MSCYIFNYNDCQDLSLVEIGKQKCTPLYSFGPFVRNEYIFHYVISGKGYLTFGFPSDKKSILKSPEPQGGPDQFEIKAGEGFLIEPHRKHMYYADQEDPWHYIWVVFRGTVAPQYLRSCGLSQSNVIYRPKDYTGQTMQRIKDHMLTILKNPNTSKSFIMGHFHLFFSELIENAANPNINVSPEETLTNYYISQATRYINSHYHDILSLNEISDFCNVSRSHLGRLFREQLHTTLQDYLITFRLTKASDLLVRTTLPICEIAEQVGYHNELNLLRAFKNKYGLSPNAYRKKNRL